MPRPKGSPNKITAEIKERLATILNEAMDSIDVKTLTVSERLKLIQIGVQYVIPRLKHTEEIREEPRNFQIEIIDSLSRYSDKDLDKKITGSSYHSIAQLHLHSLLFFDVVFIISVLLLCCSFILIFHYSLVVFC